MHRNRNSSLKTAKVESFDWFLILRKDAGIQNENYEKFSQLAIPKITDNKLIKVWRTSSSDNVVAVSHDLS